MLTEVNSVAAVHMILAALLLTALLAMPRTPRFKYLWLILLGLAFFVSYRPVMMIFSEMFELWILFPLLVGVAILIHHFAMRKKPWERRTRS